MSETAGLNAAGRPTVWRHRVADFNLSMFGAYDANYNPAEGGDPWGGFDTPYAFDSLDVTLALLETPMPTGAWRSVTYPAAVFARESFLDEIAHATGQDPLTLRLALLPSPGDVRAGQRMLPNGDRLRRVLQLAAEQAGWNGPFENVRQGRRWGRGIACNGYHQRTMVAQVAEVSVGVAGDVRVHRIVCAVDCGQVINRLGVESQFESGVLWALSAALKGRMTFTAGRADQGNYDGFPVARMNDAPRWTCTSSTATCRRLALASNRCLRLRRPSSMRFSLRRVDGFVTSHSRARILCSDWGSPTGT